MKASSAIRVEQRASSSRLAASLETRSLLSPVLLCFCCSYLLLLSSLRRGLIIEVSPASCSQPPQDQTPPRSTRLAPAGQPCRRSLPRSLGLGGSGSWRWRWRAAGWPAELSVSSAASCGLRSLHDRCGPARSECRRRTLMGAQSTSCTTPNAPYACKSPPYPPYPQSAEPRLPGWR